MSTPEVEISVLDGICEIEQSDWDLCACPETSDGRRPIDPFTTHRFLSSLERSGSVGPGTGWSARPLVAKADGKIIAVAPLYLKGHSHGEYVFDHAWAHALESAGGKYYPKLQVAVPFTPAGGRRFLTRKGYEVIGRSALAQGIIQLAANNKISSVHITFCTESEVAAGVQMGFLHRTGQQFHWANADYADFGEFTASLSSRKRKNVRRERSTANGFGGDIVELTGDAIEPHHWDAFWEFYQSTGARKWGTPYLTRAFFENIQEKMREDVLLVLAKRNDSFVAGALNFIGRQTLFGRYWGCSEHHPSLHFELCYYRAIEYAIANHLKRVEAGAQGDHKIARGYMPVATQSLHWIADPGFSSAVDEFLQNERRSVDHENEIFTSFGPFKSTGK